MYQRMHFHFFTIVLHILSRIVQLHVRQRILMTFLIMRDLIPGCSGGHVKCMEVSGKIVTSGFKIPAKCVRAVSHIPI